jgi:P-loop Domain of unknown function (DUF2791)
MTLQTTGAIRIKERDRQAIIKALRAGVVPRVGLQHVQVGRKAEVAAIVEDLTHAEQGGAGVRFVIGRFGAGKSFFLNLATTVALEKGFLVARADITTDRRLHGTGGQARALFAELMRNLASKARPEGGALGPVLEKWISEVVHEVGDDDGAIEEAIVSKLRPLQDLVSGFELHVLLSKYTRAYKTGDDATQQCVIRWLRAEYDTKTEARNDLGVRTIIEDRDFYDYLKLVAAFARIAGYKGLLVCIDELVVLSHRLASRQARHANYEAILRIVNDCLQGNVEGLQILFGGTDECLTDKRRGLHSYEALATRLSQNEFDRNGTDLTGPVITLKSLTPEDLFVLLMRVRDVFARGDSSKYLLPDEGLTAFLEYSRRRLGEEFFASPRDTVTRFVGFLQLLETDAALDWRVALGQVGGLAVEPSTSAEAKSDPVPEGDDLVQFKL